MQLYWLYIKTGLSFLKKSFLVISIFVAIISIFFYYFAKETPKQTEDPIKKGRAEIYQYINDPELKKSDNGQAKIAVYRTSMCVLLGEACTDRPEDGNQNFKSSLMGFMTKLIVMPYANPPASGVYWARSGLENAGFIPHTYAAGGIGFNALTPFQGIWVIFRNFVFMIMVIAIVAIGFLIMFRVKINPQTVVSVENALPKIVLTLIFITFSYPLAGFMIDLMYVVIGFILTMFATNPNLHSTPAQLLTKYFFNGADTLLADFSPFSVNFLWPVASAFYEIIPTAIRWGIDYVGAILTVKLGTAAVGAKIPGLKFVGSIPDLISNLANPISNNTNQVAGTGTNIPQTLFSLFLQGVGWAIGLTLLAVLTNYFIIASITLVLCFSLFFIFLRLFFMVLSAYLNILFLIIFSPLIIGLNAIPGRSTFKTWFKNLTSHLLTFPMIIAIVQIDYIIFNAPSSQNLWQPPYFFGLNGDLFKTIVAGGLLFMTPDLVRTFKELMGFKAMPISFGFGSLFTGATSAGGGAIGLLGTVSSVNMATAIFRKGGLLGKYFDKDETTNAVRTGADNSGGGNPPGRPSGPGGPG